MEKKEIKPLTEQLLNAINRVMKENKIDLTKKNDKRVRKTIKRIVKKADKQIKKALKKDKGMKK